MHTYIRTFLIFLRRFDVRMGDSELPDLILEGHSVRTVLVYILYVCMYVNVLIKCFFSCIYMYNACSLYVCI
jgi:hypothetical protein